MDLTVLGRWIVIVGLALAGLGLLIWLAGKSLLPIGQLPGDIRIKRDGSSFYFPIVTCIVLSVVLTIVLNILVRLFRK